MDSQGRVLQSRYLRVESAFVQLKCQLKASFG